MSFTFQSYIFDPRPNYPFLITANCYRYSSASQAEHTNLNSTDPDALTLVLTHGTGFHKEVWEPIIEDLYKYLQETDVKIREIWSIEAPNHGDAAVLNEETLSLSWGYDTLFCWEEYARSIHLFLSGFGTGIDVDFRKRNIVGIGHSMGAVSFILATAYTPPLPAFPCILIEPMTMLRKFSMQGVAKLQYGAEKRRDIWPSADDAYNTLRSRKSFQLWDQRVLKIYVEKGMRPLPTLGYPDKTDGVTLKCTRHQETITYRDGFSYVRAYHLLKHVAKRMPVHIIYGAIDDHVPREAKDDVLHVASGGIDRFISVAWIEGAGHLVAHAKPTLVAEKIGDALLHPGTYIPKIEKQETKHLPAARL